MKPDAPKSMQRRITAGSSLADTTTTGTLGYCARRYIRPEKPRTPGMREIEQHEIDVAALVEQLDDIVERAGLGDLGAREQRRTPPRATRRGTADGRRRSPAGSAGRSWRECYRICRMRGYAARA